MRDLFLVVMAGGSGTRFWPKSTSSKPKQLLSFGPRFKGSLLTQTLDRFVGIVPLEQHWIVTTQLLSDAVIAEAPKAKVLAEPQGRNTAPCIYWAAREIAKENPEAVMLVMPSDHFITRPEKFKESIMSAIEWAKQHSDLVTLGVKPSHPETGYGYLKLGKSLGSGCAQVEAFVEKPNLEKAQEFVRSKQYLWNGGMFVWKTSAILEAFDWHMPEMKKAWDTSQGKIEIAYPKMTATSIDFGVMERSSNVVTFELDCGWNDLGSWTALGNVAEELGAQQEYGILTAGQMISVDSSHNVIDVPGKLVALLGVHNLIVAQNGDALLIAHQDRAQDIRAVVDAVKKTRPDLV